MKKITPIFLTLILFFSLINLNIYGSQDEIQKEKVIYITFDDGPNINTPKILDILKEYNMKATFFVLEPKIKANSDIIKRMIDEGHSIGLHGVSHEKDILYANDLSVINEMNKTKDTIEKTIGYSTKIVRVPYGSKPHLTNNQYKSLIDNGYEMWDWNIDSTDTYKNTSSKQIINHTITELKKYNKPVILFHDKQVTVNALPTIMKYLKNNGYKSQIIEKDKSTMNWWNGKLYN